MGKETKYSALSVLFLAAVILFHLIHWLSVPMLIGAAAETQMHTHMHHQGAAGGSPLLLQLLLPAIIVLNVISAVYAARQLTMAWKKRSSVSTHSYVCSAVSLGAIGMAIYSTLSF
jgi:hypothetical protein